MDENKDDVVSFFSEGNKTHQHVVVNRDITERKSAEELVIANKELVFQNQEKEKRASELLIANKELAFQNEEKEKRASELIIADIELAFQNEEKEKRASELLIANKELVFQNEEKEKRASELVIANKELAYQNQEKENRASELIVANKELVFQNEEKENRASELNTANKELVFQNKEKEKRAEELVVANKELAYQNEEKEKRASELITANKELAFQNEEKEKRAAELIIANKELIFQNEEKEKRAEELAYQNEEKEKRAAELITANKELAFQNEEKEKRAAELIIANKELIFQNKEKEKRAAELIIANRELKKAENDIRKLNAEDIRKLNDELEQKVFERTAQLESANQELESFSYSVSHDLRAPLRAVNGFAILLGERYSSLFDNEGRRLLNIIQDNANKMGTLIDDLLTFSRLGRKEIHRSMTDMTKLAENALRELNTSEQFKAVVKINDLHQVLADTTLMHQVWMNLLSNAIKYSFNKKNPVITISSEEKNGELIYCIADNGVGFNMRYAHKLFGVFQRLHDEDDFEGTGVGLALVHRIITKQGGKIWATARVGKGATFYFSLPDKKATK